MADPYHERSRGQQLTHRRRHAVPGKSVLYASLAGVAVGGPLFVMMGFSFLPTLTLLLICSPLMLIFSPLLLCTAFVFVGALAGFAAAGGMAVVGVSTLAWSYREVIGGHLGSGFGGGGGERFLKEEESDLQQRVQENQPQQHQENRLIIVQ